MTTIDSTCDICDGAGFMSAAPLSILGGGNFGRPTTNPVIVSSKVHRRAMWSRSVAVPCWGCRK